MKQGETTIINQSASRQPFHLPSGSNIQKQHLSGLYAALDLGTNNCRLLIAKPSHNGFRVYESFSRIVRLGEGLEQHRELSEAAIERTISALRICAQKIRKHNIRRMRCIATEACRDSRNGVDFIKRVRRETGLRLEIIDGESEARLAVKGCEALFDKTAKSLLVFDIGGGSTELIRLDKDIKNRFALTDMTSLPLGVVRLAERFSVHGNDRHHYDDMLAFCHKTMSDFFSRQNDLTDLSALQIIGTSGTVTTLAAVQKNLAAYDRKLIDGQVFSTTSINKVIGDLKKMPHSALIDHPLIGEERRIFCWRDVRFLKHFISNIQWRR